MAKYHLIKRLGSALFVFFLAVVFLPAQVLAQGEKAPPTESDLLIHRYLAGSGKGLPNDGTEVTQGLENALPVEGITYTLYLLDVPDGTNITAENAAEYIVAGSEKTAKTDGNATASFSGLSQGYYYVLESDSQGTVKGETSPRYHIPVAPFLIKLPLKASSDAHWLTQVHVYPKSENIIIDKFVNGSNADPDFSRIKNAKYMPVSADANFGWTVEASIPADIGGENRSYSVIDELPPHTTFDIASVAVYAVPDKTAATAERVQLSLSDYLVEKNDKNSFTLTLTDTGRTKLQEIIDTPGAGEKWLRIKYNGTLKTSAAQGVSHFGNATVRYTVAANGAAQPGQQKNVEVAVLAAMSGQQGETTVAARVLYEPGVHSGQINLLKFDASSKSKTLPGAVFGIAATKADAESGIYLQQATTNRQGEVVFSGLAYGAPGDRPEENSAGTTYWVFEITAPAGYKKLVAPFEAVFDFGLNKTDGQYYIAQLLVYNQPVETIPTATTPRPGGDIQTGDNGLPVYIPILILLISVAGILLLWRRLRKRS